MHDAPTYDTSPTPPPGAPAPGDDPRRDLARDLLASVVVFLVALPLCLGIALASDAPMSAGLIAGVVGGALVGWLSGSHTSVSGPAAGLAAIVAVQVHELGSFDAFLAALVIAGALQLALGLLRAGAVAAVFPASVVAGLLVAIGALLVIKQLPHLLGYVPATGHPAAPGGAGAAYAWDTLRGVIERVHPGATLVGLLCLASLVAWNHVGPLRRSQVPAPLVVVALGVLVASAVEALVPSWAVGPALRVALPALDSGASALDLLRMPEWDALGRPAVLRAGLTLAIVASLETLLNLDATDRLDPRGRRSPPNRELLAQGAGNLACGLLGGLPVTSVIVRSSVNLHAGARSKCAAILHGLWILVAVLLFPGLLARIPLASLAAILIVTGYKLAAPAHFREVWSRGPRAFWPFLTTAVAIVLGDLLLGVLLGLGVHLALGLPGRRRRGRGG